MKFFKQLLNLPTLIIAIVALVATIAFYIAFPNLIGVYSTVFLILLILFIFLLFVPNLIKDNEGENKISKFTFINKIKEYFSSKENKIALVRQIFALILFFIFLTRFFLNHDYLESVVSMESDILFPVEIVFSTFLNQWWIGSIILILINEFVKSEIFETLVKFISTPILVLSFFLLFLIIPGICGDISLETLDPRAYLMGAELGISLAFVASIWFKNHSFKLTKELGISLGLGYFLLIIANFSGYIPKIFFGTSIGELPLPLDLNWTHRVYIYILILLPILYFVLLYRYDYKHRRYFLTYISICVLFSYLCLRRYEIFESPRSLQLHLCNLAMFIIPITLVFKTTKVFYFTMFINVIGAILAFLMPNYNEGLGIFDVSVIEFFINHLYAAFMPILIVLLGVYERPKMKYFIYSMVGFLIYYLFILVWNTYFGTDYFFINSNFVADKLGDWAEDIFNMEASFEIFGKTLTFHPVYQIIFFVVYVIFAFIMWYIYELLFKIVDNLTLLVEKNKIVKKKNNEFILYLESVRGKSMKEIKKENLKIDYDELEANLKIEHLNKRYGNAKKAAVEDFSLTLEGGKIYGFLGKNGAGKSTIIKSIVGMHTFNSGKITVCGFDINHQPVEAKSLIGFVPDHYALYENLTGRQYINYIADLYNVSKKDREERLKDLLPRLELEDKIDKQIKTYSHGMKQKITIIGALIHNPKIWILDEPMTGVDPNSIFQIKECMREHAKKGNIVFFSSHLIDVVSNLCDEVIMIKHGDFILRTSLEELKQNNVDLEWLFLEKTKDDEDIKDNNLEVKGANN